MAKKTPPPTKAQFSLNSKSTLFILFPWYPKYDMWTSTRRIIWELVRSAESHSPVEDLLNQNQSAFNKVFGKVCVLKHTNALRSIGLNSGSQSVISGPAVLALSGDLLEMQILGPSSRTTKSEHLCFNKLFRWFDAHKSLRAGGYTMRPYIK